MVLDKHAIYTDNFVMIQLVIVYGKGHILDILDSWRSVLPWEVWHKEGSKYLRLLNVQCHQVPFPLQHLACIFLNLPFTAAVPVEVLLVDLHITNKESSSLHLTNLSLISLYNYKLHFSIPKREFLVLEWSVEGGGCPSVFLVPVIIKCFLHSNLQKYHNYKYFLFAHHSPKVRG